MKIKQYLTIFISLLCNIVFGQTVSNVRAIQNGQKIEISYNLEKAGLNQLFDITVYCSANGGYSWGSTLKKVQGDVGKGISGGNDKSITWFVLNEWGKINSENVLFKVQANIKGSTKTINKSNSFIDTRNQKSYPTIQIGSNVWMGININYQTTDNCYCFDDNKKNCEKFGYLYDYETALNICPQGWHLPTKQDFQQLIDSYNDPNSAYLNLVDEGKSGMNIKLCGWRQSLGFYQKENSEARYWTSTKISTNAIGVIFDRLNKTVYTDFYEIKQAFSVRCVKD